MSLTNVPRKADRGVEMRVEVAGNDIVLWNVNKSDDRGSKMETIYVGSHMLMADNQTQLLEMLGREMLHLIVAARDAGYKQAQQDIKQALGL
ncbi:hypothetical protein [Bradyrhizobium cenepequi]